LNLSSEKIRFQAFAFSNANLYRYTSELGVDYWAQYNFIRRGNAGVAPVTSLEASLGGAVQVAFSVPTRVA
jgi:hypothetical protein